MGKNFFIATGIVLLIIGLLLQSDVIGNLVKALLDIMGFILIGIGVISFVLGLVQMFKRRSNGY